MPLNVTVSPSHRTTCHAALADASRRAAAAARTGSPSALAWLTDDTALAMW